MQTKKWDVLKDEAVLSGDSIGEELRKKFILQLCIHWYNTVSHIGKKPQTWGWTGMSGTCVKSQEAEVW